MNQRNIVRSLTNIEGLELIMKDKAEHLYTSLYPWDRREVIKYKTQYYIRDKNMNYELMQNITLYHKDGTKNQGKLL